MEASTAPTSEADLIHQRRWMTLVVLCLSLVTVILGNTVLNVALPTLARDLDATSTQLQWMVDSYALVFAGLLLTGGALGDRFGRKGALQIGLTIFGSASLLSTVATTADHLVATRALMGVGAALVMPATLSILTNVFPPQERARAIAIWAGLAGSGAAIGPIAGGWLLEHFWWGAVFLLNVPVVVVALVAGRVLVPRSSDPAHPPLDPRGALLSIVGLGALLYAIIEAPSHGWTDVRTILGFALAVVVLAVFGWWERRAEHPMLDLGLFRDRRFTAASTAITLTFFAMFGTFFLLTQHLQLVLGYSAFQAGLRTLPMALTMMATAPNSARVVERFGARRVIVVGLLLVTAGLTSLSLLEPSTPYPQLAVSLVVLALGMGLTMPPSTTLIMTSLPLGKAGVGSAVNDTTRELGGALGVAILGSLLTSSYTSGLSSALQGAPAPAAEAARSSLGGALAAADGLGGGAGEALAAAARGAFVDGLGIAVLVAAAMTLLGAAFVAWYLPGGRALDVAAGAGQPVETGRQVPPVLDTARSPEPARAAEPAVDPA
jgi:EmrB/QacA subfamily drug resistance transporter